MAAAGAKAARCLTVLLTLALLLGHSGQALELEGAGAAAVNPSSNEEVKPSLLALQKHTHNRPNAASASACPHRWVRRESSCYLIDETGKRTWEESRGYCRSFGADLVKITSEGENEFIRGQLDNSVWIGLNARTTMGRFVWADSSQPTYTAWHRGEPNGGSKERCGEMRKRFDYAWNDWPCHNKIGVVCEKAVYA